MTHETKQKQKHINVQENKQTTTTITFVSRQQKHRVNRHHPLGDTLIHSLTPSYIPKPRHPARRGKDPTYTWRHRLRRHNRNLTPYTDETSLIETSFRRPGSAGGHFGYPRGDFYGQRGAVRGLRAAGRAQALPGPPCDCSPGDAGEAPKSWLGSIIPWLFM